MGFDTNTFCRLTGLQYDSKEKTFWGSMQGGYPVFVQIVPRRDTISLRLVAKLPAGKTEADAAAVLEPWRMAHAGVAVLVYRDRGLSAIVSLAKDETESRAASVTAELVALAADLGMIPCCMVCGTERGFSQFLLDGTGVTVCDECRPHVESQMQADTEKHAEQKPNRTGLIAGAIAGAVLVFLLTFAVLKLSYLSILTGYAGLVAGLLLMKKLGKKLTRPAVILCAVLCLTAGSCAAVLHLSSRMAEANRENAVQAETIRASAQELLNMMDGMAPDELAALTADLGADFDRDAVEESLTYTGLVIDNQTTGACLLAFPKFMQHEVFRSGLLPELAKCLLCLLASVLLGVFVTAPKLLRAESGVHQLKALEAV